MNSKKTVALVLVFIAVIIIFFTTIFLLDGKYTYQDNQKRQVLSSNVKFKGRSVNSKIHDFAGKKYYIVCIKLDSCNVKSFYILNDLSALKIKDSIATFSGGVFNPDDGIVKYVEVNMNSDGKMKFIFANGKTVIKGGGLPHTNGLTEQDLNLCN